MNNILYLSKTSLPIFVVFFVDLLFCQNLVAAPLLAINQTLWNEKTKLVLANCSNTKPQMHTNICCLPKPSEDKSFEFLDLVIVSENNQQSIFAVSAERDHTVSILYYYELKDDGSLSKAKPLFQLNFGAATAKLGVYTVRDQRGRRQENQKPVLVLIANATEDLGKKPQSYAMAFEVFQGELSPFERKGEEGMQGNLESITSMAMLKLKNENRVLALAGLQNQEKTGQGAVRFIFLDSLTSPVQLKTNKPYAITQLIALDQNHENVSDVLYAWDSSGGIWRKDLTSFLSGGLQKIYDMGDLTLEDRAVSPLKVVKSLNKPGIWVYLLGHKTGGKTTLYCLEIPQQDKPSMRAVIEDKSFSAVFARFGRLILVPKFCSELTKTGGIQVLELGRKAESLLQMNVTSQTSEDQRSILQSSDVLVRSFLLWDPKQQKEVLVSLSQNCELNILTAEVTKDKYMRMVWRKDANSERK